MKKILVLCTSNACRSQMAEAYLRFFTQGTAEVFSAGAQPNRIHPLAIEVMRDDNIDISQAYAKSLEDFSGSHFDYLLSVCGVAHQEKPANITADRYFFYDIPDPEAFAGEVTEEKTAYFLEVREEIKREMLRFIGKRDDLKFSAPSTLEY